MARRDQTKLIELLLKVGENVGRKTITPLQNVFGYDCEIYFPVARATTTTNPTPDLFNTDSQSRDHNDAPDVEGNYIVIGLLNDEQKQADETFDNYQQGEVYLLTHTGETFPENAKILIFAGERRWIYRILRPNIFPATDGRIYHKHPLVPWN
jgi:hypothetical protein